MVDPVAGLEAIWDGKTAENLIRPEIELLIECVVLAVNRVEPGQTCSTIDNFGDNFWEEIVRVHEIKVSATVNDD